MEKRPLPHPHHHHHATQYHKKVTVSGRIKGGRREVMVLSCGVDIGVVVCFRLGGVGGDASAAAPTCTRRAARSARPSPRPEGCRG